MGLEFHQRLLVLLIALIPELRHPFIIGHVKLADLRKKIGWDLNPRHLDFSSALPTELPIFERAVGTDEVLQRRLHLSNYVRVTPLPFIIAYEKLTNFVIVLSYTCSLFLLYEN